MIMKDFDSLLKTKFSKRKGRSGVEEIYSQAKHTNKNVSLEELQTLNINDLLGRNIKNKINNHLLSLWGMLDMKSFVDAILGNTVNPYFLNTRESMPIKDLEEYTYLSDKARLLDLIDIKYIKSFTLEGISFHNIFLVTYEILDRNDEFRPYCMIYRKSLCPPDTRRKLDWNNDYPVYHRQPWVKMPSICEFRND